MQIGMTLSYAAGGAASAGNRFVSAPELQPGGRGWGAEVDRVLLMIEELKPDLVLVHDPFGITPRGGGGDGSGLPGTMEFDQYLLAQSHGLARLTDGFAAAWRRVTRLLPVIGYTGNLSCPTMAGMYGFESRAERAAQPFLAAGMQLAVDAAVTLANGTRGAAMLSKWDRDRGPVLVEGRWESNTWCHGMPCFVIDTEWQKYVAAGFAGGYAGVKAPTAGEPPCYRLLNEAALDAATAARIADCRALGHVPMLGPWAYLGKGKTLHGWYGDQAAAA